MDKKALLNVLLDAQIKCKNFHFICTQVTLTKYELKYLIKKLEKEVKE